MKEKVQNMSSKYNSLLSLSLTRWWICVDFFIILFNENSILFLSIWTKFKLYTSYFNTINFIISIRWHYKYVCRIIIYLWFCINVDEMWGIKIASRSVRKLSTLTHVDKINLGFFFLFFIYTFWDHNLKSE